MDFLLFLFHPAPQQSGWMVLLLDTLCGHDYMSFCFCFAVLGATHGTTASGPKVEAQQWGRVIIDWVCLDGDFVFLLLLATRLSESTI